MPGLACFFGFRRIAIEAVACAVEQAVRQCVHNSVVEDAGNVWYGCKEQTSPSQQVEIADGVDLRPTVELHAGVFGGVHNVVRVRVERGAVIVSYGIAVEVRNTCETRNDVARCVQLKLNGHPKHSIIV